MHRATLHRRHCCVILHRMVKRPPQRARISYKRVNGNGNHRIHHQRFTDKYRWSILFLVSLCVRMLRGKLPCLYLGGFRSEPDSGKESMRNSHHQPSRTAGKYLESVFLPGSGRPSIYPRAHPDDCICGIEYHDLCHDEMVLAPRQ